MYACAYNYYINISNLKKWFVNNSGTTEKQEAYKIWSRWIITHLSLKKQVDPFLPYTGVYSDVQIIKELISKGSTLKKATAFYRIFLAKVREFLKTHPPQPPRKCSWTYEDRDTYFNPDILCTCDTDHSTVNLSYNKIIHTISTVKYQQLCELYNTCNYGFGNRVNYHIWTLYTQYNLLDGKSLQWALPPAVFQLLSDYMGCQTELFASPINSTYRQYYSLFQHDKFFGSRGNFFTAPDSDFVAGCYQANPPVIDAIFSRTADRINNLLQIAEKNSRELTFVFIMPNWLDCQAYREFTASPYCRKELILKHNEHRYIGENNRFIRVHFNTHIFFLSTNVRICSTFLENQIRQRFR